MFIQNLNNGYYVSSEDMSVNYESFDGTYPASIIDIQDVGVVNDKHNK